MRGDNEDSEQSVHNKTKRGSPLNNAGRQSDSNVRRTLDHVEPTMGGVVTEKVIRGLVLFQRALLLRATHLPGQVQENEWHAATMPSEIIQVL